ncbi:MAG: glycosyltransferase [Opitutales bacterium]|nr:glycosyltransferase [Opitutales bacterium]
MNSQDYWLTIVTVCLNAEQTIRRTLESVERQDLSGVEYIVVDGVSKDSTLQIVARFQAKGVVTCVISEEDSGLYDAMNKGIRMSHGQYVLMLNADDELISADALARLRPLLKENCLNYAGVLIDDGKSIRDTGKRVFKSWKMWYRMEIYHPGIVVSRKQYEQTGLYDLTYRIASDTDMVFRLVRAYQLNKLPLGLVRMHAGGLSTTHANKGFVEFEEVSVRYGLPRPLARLIRLVKLMRTKCK